MRLALAAGLIGAAIFAPLLVFGSLVRETLDRDIVARSAAERLVTARIAAASIDQELRAATDSIALFASGPTLQGALRARDRDVLDRRLAELLHDRRNSLGAALDPTGIALAAPLARDLVGQSFAQRDYFRGALASSGAYVSEIFTSASPGNPSVVAVATAVRDGSTTLGVVVLTIAPADLLGILQPLQQVEGRHLLVLDKAGRVVAATDPRFRPLAVVSIPAAAAPTEPIEISGQPRIVTYGPVTSADWTLYVLDDPSIVLMGERRLRDQLRDASGAVGVIALIAAAVVFLLYGTTVRQRDQLSASRAQLAETNRALAEASGHKSEFLASMSHELRTPLNAILGFSDLLVEQLGDAMTDRQRRYLRNIRDAGDHLLGLINDVLDLSKVEAGRVELRPEPIAVRALVDPVVASTRSAARIRGVAFDVRSLADGAVSVDPARVRQILYNLLSNAVKFTPPGGSVTLTIEADGADLVAEVADTGIGIPADKRDRVFGTFERLHEGRSDAPGTGLGLALTKRLVELHGGTIGFESEEGHGSTFRVRLHGVFLDLLPADRLLVVEDEPRDAELIVALATRAGLASEVVRTVDAARSAIRRARPTAVVLDLRLPDGRGEAVLESLQADGAASRVPVVVVTVEDDERHSRDLGADDHLTKPIDHARLDGWLRQIAARHGRKEVPLAAAAGR